MEMHERMVGALMNRAEKTRDEGFRRHGKAINEEASFHALLRLLQQLLATWTGVCTTGGRLVRQPHRHR